MAPTPGNDDAGVEVSVELPDDEWDQGVDLEDDLADDDDMNRERRRSHTSPTSTSSSGSSWRRPTAGPWREPAGVVRRMVAPRRSHQPARIALACLGAPAPGPRHRHEHLVARPRRPPHARPAGSRRAVQGLRQRPWPSAKGLCPTAASGSTRASGVRGKRETAVLAAAARPQRPRPGPRGHAEGQPSPRPPGPARARNASRSATRSEGAGTTCDQPSRVRYQQRHGARGH